MVEHQCRSPCRPSMPRKRLHRERCECLDCRPVIPPSVTTPESVAAARQDPPPKCLVIYTDSVQAEGENAVLCTTDDETLPYLHAVTKRGCCGLVSYRQGFSGVFSYGLDGDCDRTHQGFIAGLQA